MATKAQEREALEKIRKIIEELGENSYLGTAFEGFFEIAEDNIENDFGCSMKQRWESAEEKLEAAGIIRSNLEKEVEALQTENKLLGERIEQHDKDYEALRLKKEEYRQSTLENWNKYKEAQNALLVAEAKITELKAKLYDMMTREEG
jgi:hypothetical protein